MTAEGETLTLEVIEASLDTQIIGRAPEHKNELWQTIDSTNSRAAELAAGGAPEGVIVLSRQQTAGRGRHGRVWVTPPDAGIAFSVILRPTIPLTRLPLVTLATGTAVARAIEKSVGVRLGLKWVNDLVLGGRKVGGILAEMPGQALIVGIGINVRFAPQDVPEDLQTKIEWLERVVGRPVDPNLIVVALADELEKSYQALLAGKVDEIVSAWKSYSVTIGQNIKSKNGGQTLRGRAVDITTSGALVVELEDGTRTELHAGEISIRNQDGSYA
ncbi:MAG: biotin--[acetyl-CoA-carboxylase] ligase [Cyanobacteria bacterium SZAS TMP-1]|nr:biotin--[acetyl-CoA-carboxylase] ligase [Cyanobacteria bacterium SZAS TMP-1]